MWVILVELGLVLALVLLFVWAGRPRGDKHGRDRREP